MSWKLQEEIKRRQKDILLLAFLLAAGVALASLIYIGQEEGTMVEVRVAGEVLHRYPLDRDLDKVIMGRSGGTNHLRIEAGEAWLEDASCPDGLCVHMGKISRVGQSIICLPNQVVIEVTSGGSQKDPGVDASVG